jgi:hypothetical protein
MREIAEQFSGFGFKDLRSNWNTDDMVYTAVARAIRAFSMQSTIGDVARVIAEMQQGIERRIRDYKYISTAAPITSRRTTTRHKLLPPESSNSVTTITPLNVNLNAINKHLN